MSSRFLHKSRPIAGCFTLSREGGPFGDNRAVLIGEIPMLSYLLLLLAPAAEIPVTKDLADLPKPSAIVPLKLDSEVIRVKAEAKSPPRHRVLCEIGLSEELVNKLTPP